MSWSVRFSNQAADFIKKLKDKQLIERILKTLKTLEYGPYSLKYEKMKGESDIYRVRVGKYRIKYFFENNEKTIYILKIKHKKNIYD